MYGLKVRDNCLTAYRIALDGWVLSEVARCKRRTPYACTISWYLFSRIRNSSCAISLTKCRMSLHSRCSAGNIHTEGLKSLQGSHAQHEVLLGHV